MGLTRRLRRSYGATIAACGSVCRAANYVFAIFHLLARYWNLVNHCESSSYFQFPLPTSDPISWPAPCFQQTSPAHPRPYSIMSVPEQAQVSDPDGQTAPVGFKAKLPMIAMVAVGIAIGGGTGAAVIGPMVAKKMGKVAPAHADSAAALGDSAAAGGEHATADGAKSGGGEASVHLLENLVLNPAGSNGSRFLLLSVAIETGTANIAADMTTRDAELRDIILTSLGTKTVDQLTDISTREGIKVELQTAITGRFGKTAVKRLYFPQFVVQ